MTVVSSGQTYISAVTYGAGAVNAYSVQVRLQATDLSLLNGQITSVSSRSSSTAIPAYHRQTSTRSSSTLSTSSSSNLSAPTSPAAVHHSTTASAAGIGIGVALAVILAFVGVLLLVRRRRYRNPGDGSVPVNAEQPGHVAAYATLPEVVSANYPLPTAARYDSTMFSASVHNSLLQSAGPIQPLAGGHESSRSMQYEQGEHIMRPVEFHAAPTELPAN
jgi:hypothetical protein